MHFDQSVMRQISDNARALEVARKQLDAAQKAGAEWPTIERLQAAFDAAQEKMIQVGVQASHSLPRSVKQEA
jgi:hypothetical protein